VERSPAQLPEALRQLRGALVFRYGALEAAAIARLVMSQLTGLPTDELALAHGKQLTAEQQHLLAAYQQRLKAGEPVQYVLGTVSFGGLQLRIGPEALIPRPETEELVAQGLAWLRQANLSSPRVLDVCSGSGCIALAVQHAYPKAEVLGYELSEAALRLARQNAERLFSATQSPDFQAVDVRNAWPKAGHFHLLLSNPPYVPASEVASLTEHVRLHEPHEALFVPNDDALLFYRIIAAEGPHVLAPNGAIGLETHTDYTTAVADLFRQAGYREVTQRADAFGRERFVWASGPLRLPS